MSHREAHPVAVEGCFGCKVLSINIGAGALEVRGAAVRQMDAKDKALDGDLGAYKRLRANGLQPKSIDGSADLERSNISGQADIDLGVIVPKDQQERVAEGFAMAKEMTA